MDFLTATEKKRAAYVLVYMENDNKTEIGWLNDKREVFGCIKSFLLLKGQKPGNYRVIETDKYTQYKNGDYTFRLYKQKGE